MQNVTFPNLSISAAKIMLFLNFHYIISKYVLVYKKK